MNRAFIFLSFILAFGGCNSVDDSLEFAEDANVVFIGNTFAEGFQRHNYFETILYQNFPDRNLRVRNLGWSADEVGLMPRPLHFPSMEEQLTRAKADIIFVCFGLNESYAGPDSVDVFKRDLEAFLLKIQDQKFNGISVPNLVLISPVAYEQIAEYLPDEEQINQNLETYSFAIRDLAGKFGIKYVDVFHPLRNKMQMESKPLTTNGIHLNDLGRVYLTEVLGESLNLKMSKWKGDSSSQSLRKIITEKNKQFFHVYRPSNSEYYVGRRKDWEGGQTLQSEIEEISAVVSQLDTMVWEFAQTSSVVLLDEMEALLSRNLNKSTSDIDKEILPPDKSQFVLKDGYEIQLFASEIDFPIGNPVSMTFDSKGRLWVATMPSYPNYFPGDPPNDKILILEDTNADGKADKYTVFADSLHLPLGIELGNGGVYVTQAPDFLFLRDTSGDDIVDTKEYLLHGFGTEDAHHSLSSYTWGPDGCLYMHMGTFLHSQVETPYGPQRGAYGTTWKYDPIRKKLKNYVSYPYANPWGNVFNRYGDHLIADASTGRCHFGSPLSTHIDYPIKHTSQHGFLTADFAPKTCGIEIISSDNFPPDVQGDILLNTFVGFQGIRQHQLIPDSSEYIGKERAPLLHSKDPNFRPVDLKFGPDGALYVMDWFSPIVQHGEQGFREPMRDHAHGRIWRITYSKNPLTPVTDFSEFSIAELLDALKTTTDREKYRIRRILRTRLDAESMPVLMEWVSGLDAGDQEADLYRLEALWLCQSANFFNLELLNSLLISKDEQVRAAAVKILHANKDRYAGYTSRLNQLISDGSYKVRLETIVALSYERSEEAMLSLLKVLDLPTDEHINYALRETLKNLQSVWVGMFEEDPDFLVNEPTKSEFLFELLEAPDLLSVPGFIGDDPSWKMLAWSAPSEKDYLVLNESKAYVQFLIKNGRGEGLQSDPGSPTSDRVTLHLKAVPGKMKYDKEKLEVYAGQSVVLVLENEDNMAHNLVFVNPGQEEKVGALADAMASESDAYEKGFIPKSEEVLFFTPLVNSGESYTLEFVAPKEKGQYPFICTFPGHWRIMKGVLIVR